MSRVTTNDFSYIRPNEPVYHTNEYVWSPECKLTEDDLQGVFHTDPFTGSDYFHQAREEPFLVWIWDGLRWPSTYLNRDSFRSPYFENEENAIAWIKQYPKYFNTSYGSVSNLQLVMTEYTVKYYSLKDEHKLKDIFGGNDV
jgi:hypothetical protein